MSDQPRPVWIDAKMIHSIAAFYRENSGIGFVGDLIEAWDAAPADPEAAITEAMLPIQAHSYDYTEEAAAVLRALGMPS